MATLRAHCPRPSSQQRRLHRAGYSPSLRTRCDGSPPSAVELIDWLRYLLPAGVAFTHELKDTPDHVRDSLGGLVKSLEDLESVDRLVAEEALGRL